MDSEPINRKLLKSLQVYASDSAQSGVSAAQALLLQVWSVFLQWGTTRILQNIDQQTLFIYFEILCCQNNTQEFTFGEEPNME